MKVTEIFNSMSYGPAPEANENIQAWLKKHQQGFGVYINGQWEISKEAKTFDSQNPANGQRLAKLSQTNQTQIDQAVKSAQEALPKWKSLGCHARARYLYAIARALQKRAREFAVLESMDNGKPIRESRDIDIPLAIRHFYHHAGWAQLLESEFPHFQPIGVIGQIIPWNFPLLMAAWKIAPALAAGNCVVLKPAEYTSLSALMLAEIFEEVGLPKGVVNIVTGDGEVGELLVKHPNINKIAFTGSTQVGRMIRQETAGSGKKLTLELGGKSPFIVFDDADIDSAIEGLVDAIWFNQGQVCCAGSRLLVQESIADDFIARLKTRMKNLSIGDPLDKNTDVGAIVDPSQRQRIDQLVKQSVSEGATLWQAEIKQPADGCFYPPSLLCDVESANVAANIEIFGPVLAVMTFRHQPEAIELANNTRYGLAASIWSENINKALDVAPQVKAGVVWINSTNQFDAACGFGGYKESGMGREGGMEGMYEYLKPLAAAVVNADPVAADSKNLNTDKNIDTMPVGLPSIDRTAKHYINGKQVRADNGNTLIVNNSHQKQIGRVSDGNRKDIRNAVEAAHKAASWGKTDGHLRAQLLYYIAENLSYRRDEFCQRLVSFGAQLRQAHQEFDAAINCLFTYAAWADKYEGKVHQPPSKGVTLAINEPLGILAIACPDESPLLAFVSMFAPAIAMGNRVVIIPSQTAPLLACDFYQVIETSDIPAGVINIVTGDKDPLVKVLADHDQVDGIWYQGSESMSKQVELASAANLKRTWVNYGESRNWYASDDSKQFLRQSCEIKNIWIPYGD